MQRASAGFRAHILEVQARRIEYHVTLDRAEPRGKICNAGRGVFDLHPAGDARLVRRKSTLPSKGRWTGRASPAGCKSKTPLPALQIFPRGSARSRVTWYSMRRACTSRI